jgi:hypothetical protein
MQILNPGNALPFYANIKSQMRYRCGCEHTQWAIPVAQGESLPFQLPVSIGLSTWNYTVHDESDAVVLTLAVNFQYNQTADGSLAWVTYTGNNASLNALPCGTYYIKMARPDGRVIRYSEQFQVMPMAMRKKAYKVTFTNGNDIDGVLYQGGYTQKFWLLDGVFDTPQIAEPTTTLTDGNAVEVPVFQSVQRREVLRFPYFPDFWQGTMHRLKMHESVLLTKMETGEVWQLAGNFPTVTTDEQDTCFQLGSLAWVASTQVTLGCNVNYTLL